MKRFCTAVLGAILVVGGCTHEAQRPASLPASTPDPQVRALRAQLARALAERDAALSRLRDALRHRPLAQRIVVREPVAVSTPARAGDQPATRVFTTLTTAEQP